MAEKIKKEIKYFLFLIPIQFPIQKQWWSKSSTH
jgi:hypothetical protein